MPDTLTLMATYCRCLRGYSLATIRLSCTVTFGNAATDEHFTTAVYLAGL